MAERLLTATDLAKRWSVSEAFVYRLAREGKIPVVRLGRWRRFRLDQIERWELASIEPSLSTLLKLRGATRLTPQEFDDAFGDLPHDGEG